MSAPVGFDYARPIGWSCPTCGMTQACWLQVPPSSTTCADGHKTVALIPVFLPLPARRRRGAK